jgi:glycosyltransferase involved in cell wall biosynthesis
LVLLLLSFSTKDIDILNKDSSAFEFLVMKKKILLFGPFSDFGGRELETGFIASILTPKYDVAICTSESLTRKSQVFDFNKNQKVYSIKGLLCDKYFAVKVLSFFSFLKNRFKKSISSYANNNIIKRYFNYEKRRIYVLEKLVIKYDMVFICAQLTSSLISELVVIAKNNNKKVLFRTTGVIESIDFDYIDSIDLFIHHSQENANRIEKFRKHNFTIIDQCAFNEKDLLNMSLSSDSIFKFLILSRLSQEKGIEKAIDFFLRAASKNDVLYIAGNGILEDFFKDKYGKLNSIKFIGFVNSSKIPDLFQSIDCLIIPSFEESGPLVGVEAMAAGKLIFTTKVGAMPERLDGTLNDFWFDINDFHSFKMQFDRLKQLDIVPLNIIANSLRDKYLQSYSVESISRKYINLISKVI